MDVQVSNEQVDDVSDKDDDDVETDEHLTTNMEERTNEKQMVNDKPIGLASLKEILKTHIFNQRLIYAKRSWVIKRQKGKSLDILNAV